MLIPEIRSELDQCVFVIAGGSRGIGRTIAQRYAAAGGSVDFYSCDVVPPGVDLSPNGWKAVIAIVVNCSFHATDSGRAGERHRGRPDRDRGCRSPTVGQRRCARPRPGRRSDQPFRHVPEIAESASFLMSDRAVHATGQVSVIDGDQWLDTSVHIDERSNHD